MHIDRLTINQKIRMIYDTAAKLIELKIKQEKEPTFKGLKFIKAWEVYLDYLMARFGHLIDDKEGMLRNNPSLN